MQEEIMNYSKDDIIDSMAEQIKHWKSEVEKLEAAIEQLRFIQCVDSKEIISFKVK